MLKQKTVIVIMMCLSACLSSCVGGIWSGASAIYDRHHVYQKLNDYQLSMELNNALAVNRTFNNSDCVLDIAVFNGDILLAGHVPTVELLDELKQRLKQVSGYRRLFNKITVQQRPSANIHDSWITTQIRGQIMADSSINPKSFKVVTSDGIVYLMGDVTQEDAEKVIQIARNVDGVVRVATLLRYVYISNKPSSQLSS
jgi:osmotically-inducible protein OsmY